MKTSGYQTEINAKIYQLKLALASIYEDVSLYDSKDMYQQTVDLYNEV